MTRRTDRHRSQIKMADRPVRPAPSRPVGEGFGTQMDEDRIARFLAGQGISLDYITAGVLQSEVTIAAKMYAPDITGWRVEIGDSTYPIRYWDGSTTNLSLDNAGNVVLAGSITAVTGTIGGWSIGATSLYSGTNIVLDAANHLISAPSTGMRAEVGDATYPFRLWDGADTRFYVDSSGNLYANSLPFGSGTSQLGSNDYIDLHETGGYSTPAVVQSQNATGSGVSTLSAAAWSPATTAGNLLIFAATWKDSRTVNTAPAGYTLGPDGIVQGGGGGNPNRTAIYYKENCSAGAATPSITLSGTTEIRIATAEISGLATSSSVDKNISATNQSPASTGTTATTTQTYEMWVGVLGAHTGTLSAPTNGFTANQNFGSTPGLALLTKAVTATGAASTGMTVSAGSAEGLMLTFKALSTTPATPGANIGRIYVKDKAGVSALYYKDDAGAEHELSATPASTVGYALQAITDATAFNPTDGTTYIFGHLPLATNNTVTDINRIYIPKAGTIKAAYVMVRITSTLASNENVSAYIRVNNTTDATISTTSQWTANPTIISNTAMSQAVSQGDYVEFKIVTPTWSTNPLSVRWHGVVYIE